ncbi:MAG TPA: nucleotide exchange factor GrpE [Candidatus Saccharimonadales bacterium]|nr:nucleotide exchange factor GrpE [Candidatus Saccharimonadales bacterium]
MTKTPKDQQKQPAEGPLSQQPSTDMAALQQQIEELTAALQRERADALNIRRRHEEQVSKLRELVKAGIIRDFLPVIDNLERALKHVPKELEGNDYIKGVEGVVRQFEKVLQDIGVERIKTVGERFDPLLHEAVSMEEGDGDQEVVSEELQSGYRLGDEVLRHAMVKVRLQHS